MPKVTEDNISVWVFSYKFAAYFQKTFPQEHLWMAVSAYSMLPKWKVLF